jgi:cytidyltransferase-like protein
MENEKFVLICGVWDLCHSSHIQLLRKASKLGKLIVGVVADEAVKRQKGNNRPIMSSEEREKIIRLLGYGTIPLDDFYFPVEWIDKVDWVAIGEDQSHFKNLDEIPYEKKIIFPRYPGISTSDIVKKIVDNYVKYEIKAKEN